MLPRKLALDIPLDPRFVGWGGEDLAWGYALTTLAGEPWRSDEPLYHLWHPTPARQSRKLGSSENERVRRLYREARLFVTDMEALVGTIPDV